MREREPEQTGGPTTTSAPVPAAAPALGARTRPAGPPLHAGNRAVARWALARKVSWHQERASWVAAGLKAGKWDDDGEGAYYVFNGLGVDDQIKVYNLLSPAERKQLEDNLDKTSLGRDQMFKSIQQAKAKAGDWWRGRTDAVADAIRRGDLFSYPDGAFWVINPLNPKDRVKIMNFLHDSQLQTLMDNAVDAEAKGVPNAMVIGEAARNAREVRRGGHTEAEVSSVVGGEGARLGQMLFNAYIKGALQDPGTRLSPGSDVALALDAVVNAIFNAPQTVGAKREALRRLTRTSTDPNAAAFGKLLGPESARDREAGGANVAALWTAYKEGGMAVPDLTRYTTLAHLEGIWAFEKGACFATAQRGGGALSSDGAGMRNASTMLGDVKVQAYRKSANQAKEREAMTAGSLVRGDEIVYIKNLGTVVDQMRTALRDGWVIHARVLSGAFLDMAGKGTPDEEHSILITGFSGDAFDYLDPDVSGGSRSRTQPFNKLFYDKALNRLTTAETDADFPVSGSFQASGVHRYQVVRLFTVRPTK